ncbi:MAG: pimeloyl-CoA dehydrogenase small subunit [Gammaproteobacteria bacterium]|jgi:alkylation response protein AidB-like acyl-CoA dehydrogenase|nr:pimeloyl-CoA dehydrogenase small subunit [Gammaproteobacteria bacterium]MBR15254.1 pimeloyl-CoA dehydrogenase small subunit [Gammaproteobacteria bacterium]HAY50601.1 pimeloyl-CoA dehydrogenase small subunit [Acidimicrobiaceae bacterium]|tara:strand:- start:940 stop:2070 length:1131 start_codon:yes stop_codon:yes gene_type:complete
MDFSFSDEQTLLQESVSRFITNDYGFESRQKHSRSDAGYSLENWQTFAELGWLGVPFSENHGGFGGGAVETMLMMEEFGKGLVVEPYLATVVACGSALNGFGSEDQKSSFIPEIIDGSKLWALAFAEPQGRFNLADLTTTATASNGSYLLSGHKSVVINGPNANFFIVSVRTSGEQRDETGVSLFIIPSDAKGLSRRDYPTVDGQRASELILDNVELDEASRLGEEGQGLNILQQAIDFATLAIGSEAVGCMEVLYKDTVEYCKNREQFGQPIGKFQVLQHRMVDMFMEHEQSKSLMFMAAMRWDEGYGAEAQKAVSAFKVQVGKSGKFVGQSAVQLHGGMGMTDELNIGHYFKRLTIIDTMFGNVDHHLKRFGSL